MDSLLKGRKCKICEKSLKLIGIQRLNGNRKQRDWNSRDYHKCCYKKILLREEMQISNVIECII